MSESKGGGGRIPSETVGNTISAWQMPQMDKQGKVLKTAGLEDKERRQQQKNERVEAVVAKKKPGPLTAEDLIKISEDAKAEGHAQGLSEGKKEGFTQGYTEGLAKGEQKAYSELKTQLSNESEKLSAIADELLEPMQLQSQCLENQIIEMIVFFTHHLIGREIKGCPEYVYHMVRKVLHELPAGAQNVRVRLHPEDAELMKKYQNALGVAASSVADPSLKRGGCIVESDGSLIDYSVENRLAEYLEEARTHDDHGLPEEEVRSFAPEANEAESSAKQEALATQHDSDKNTISDSKPGDSDDEDQS